MYSIYDLLRKEEQILIKLKYPKKEEIFKNNKDVIPAESGSSNK
jgi:hypothetical protein